jgi:hypothetical protein
VSFDEKLARRADCSIVRAAQVERLLVKLRYRCLELLNKSDSQVGKKTQAYGSKAEKAQLESAA